MSLAPHEATDGAEPKKQRSGPDLHTPPPPYPLPAGQGRAGPGPQHERAFIRPAPTTSLAFIATSGQAAVGKPGRDGVRRRACEQGSARPAESQARSFWVISLYANRIGIQAHHGTPGTESWLLPPITNSLSTGTRLSARPPSFLAQIGFRFSADCSLLA